MKPFDSLLQIEESSSCKSRFLKTSIGFVYFGGSDLGGGVLTTPGSVLVFLSPTMVRDLDLRDGEAVNDEERWACYFLVVFF